MKKTKREKRIMRHKRVRARIKGTAERLRLSIFRSNRHIFLQLINDESGKTILSASDIGMKKKDLPRKLAVAVGESLAKKAKEKNINTVVFDRGGFAYHGVVKEAAEGARKGGLKL